MTLWSQVRGFIRAFRRNAPAKQIRHSGHDLATTIRHANHATSGGEAMVPGKGQNNIIQMAADGSEAYNKSLEPHNG